MLFLKKLIETCHTFLLTDEKIQDVNQAIEEDKPDEEIRHDSYSLPSGFVWDTLDLLDPLIVSFTLGLDVWDIIISGSFGMSLIKEILLGILSSIFQIQVIFISVLNLQLKELYTLLNENYVEDDDNMFRFDYSPEFLQWWVIVCGMWTILVD